MKDPVITRMEEDLKDLDRSIHTRRIYLQTVTRLRRHFGRPLQQLEVESQRVVYGRRAGECGLEGNPLPASPASTRRGT